MVGRAPVRPPTCVAGQCGLPWQQRMAAATPRSAATGPPAPITTPPPVPLPAPAPAATRLLGLRAHAAHEGAHTPKHQPRGNDNAAHKQGDVEGDDVVEQPLDVAVELLRRSRDGQAGLCVPENGAVRRAGARCCQWRLCTRSSSYCRRRIGRIAWGPRCRQRGSTLLAAVRPSNRSVLPTCDQAAQVGREGRLEGSIFAGAGAAAGQWAPAFNRAHCELSQTHASGRTDPT